MKSSGFDYIRPHSEQEALSLLAAHGPAARIMAGGQSLVAMLNMRLLKPELLVDISGIDSLRGIRVHEKWIEISAMTTQSELLAWPALARELPLVAKALPWVGHFQTRNRGTICGSIVHCDPSSEMPLYLALLGGEVVLRSQRGERSVPAARWQVGMLTTAREPDELVTAVRFPRARQGEGFGFQEVARRHGDFAIVALAARSSANTTALAVAGVADVPTVCDVGQLTGAELSEKLHELAWSLGGSDDIHASARYRRELIRRLGPLVIEEARSCRS